MDDSSVSTAKLSVVLRQRAYILFYVREEPETAPVAVRPAAGSTGPALQEEKTQAEPGIARGEKRRTPDATPRDGGIVKRVAAAALSDSDSEYCGAPPRLWPVL